MRRVTSSKKKGLFITFEGIEGSGKSTQIKALAQWLTSRKNGRNVLLTREPGGTPLADKIRKTLLDTDSQGITSDKELFLYEVARRDHVLEVIRPALARGEIVLCDRFTDATLAYQGYGRGLSLKKIGLLNQAATGGLKPDLTLLLDVPVDTGLNRARKRSKKLDRIDQESASFHTRVRRGYLTLARKETRRFRIIHASGSEQDTFARIRREVEKLL